jgi:hypothetical protein
VVNQLKTGVVSCYNLLRRDVITYGGLSVYSDIFHMYIIHNQHVMRRSALENIVTTGNIEGERD